MTITRQFAHMIFLLENQPNVNSSSNVMIQFNCFIPCKMKFESILTSKTKNRKNRWCFAAKLAAQVFPYKPEPKY